MIYPQLKHHAPEPGLPSRWIGQWKTTIVSPKGNAKLNSLYSTVHISWWAVAWKLLLHTGEAWQQQTKFFGPLIRWYRSRKENEPGAFSFSIYFGRWGYKGYQLEIWFTSSAVDMDLYVGSPHSERDWRIHLGIPFLHISLTSQGLWPQWAKPAESREFSLGIHNYTVRWNLWLHHTYDYEKRPARWRNGGWNYADWLLGEIVQEKSLISRYENVPVAMPEGNYLAVVEMDQIKLRRPRWPWPVANFRYGNVEVADGIPIPGKFGGNGLSYSFHGPARTEAIAIGKFIEHIYAKRGIGGEKIENELAY